MNWKMILLPLCYGAAYLGAFRLFSGGWILAPLLGLVVLVGFLGIALALRLEAKTYLNWKTIGGVVGLCAAYLVAFALVGGALRQEYVAILGWAASPLLAILVFELKFIKGEYDPERMESEDVD